jgi:chromosome segregation ATPase
MTAKISKSPKKKKKVEPTLHDVMSVVTKLDSKFDKLETKVDKIDVRLGKLENKFDKLETKVDKIDANVTLLDERIGTEVSRLEETIEKRTFSSEEREELLEVARHYDQWLEEETLGKRRITLTRSEYNATQKVAGFPNRFMASPGRK